MERKLIKTPSTTFKKLRAENWGTIVISNDVEINHWLESMPAGEETCPNWYSIRLFRGTETSPGTNKHPEYWLGICNVFLMPVLPIPLISDEIVIKLGDNLEYYYELEDRLGSHFAHKVMRNRETYFNKIIEKATVQFVNSDIKYKNDEIWSTY